MCTDIEILEYNSFHDLMYVKLLHLRPEFYCRLEKFECQVYKLNNNKTLLIPNVEGRSLIFGDFQTMMNCIEKHGIPLEPLNKDFFRSHQKEILGIESNLKYFISTLEEITQNEVLITTDVLYLHSISKLLNKELKRLGDLNFGEKYFISIGIYTGEIIRKIIESEWALERRVWINPYFVPQLIDHEFKKKFNIWPPLAQSVFERRKIDIIYNIKRSGVGGNKGAADYFDS